MKVFLLYVNIYKWKGEDPNKRNFVSLHSPVENFSDFAPSLEALDGRTLNTFFFTTKSEYGYESENSTPQVIQISKSKHNLDLNNEFHD